MAFKIEASPGVDIARLPNKFGKHNSCSHWMIGRDTVSEYSTDGRTTFVGLRRREVSSDFSLPALCAIRTFREYNFINGEVISSGESKTFELVVESTVWRLIVTSL